MSAWYGCAGLLLFYNWLAKRHEKPYACHSIRELDPPDKAVAVLAWLWLGTHVFLKRRVIAG